MEHITYSKCKVTSLGPIDGLHILHEELMDVLNFWVLIWWITQTFRLLYVRIWLVKGHFWGYNIDFVGASLPSVVIV